MKPASAFTITLVACLLPSLALAESGQVELQTDGQVQRKVVEYNCGAEGPLKVTYVNAEPNYLAILPVTGQSHDLVFTSVLSGSGARYASGKYVWWTSANSGSLYDTTEGANAAPILSCTQIPGAS